MNCYIQGEFDVTSLDEENAGVKIAKRVLLVHKISLLYFGLLLFLGYYYLKDYLGLYIDGTFNIALFASILTLYAGLLSAYANMTKKKLLSLEPKDVHDYGLYLFHKHVFCKLPGNKYNFLRSMAVADARMGDKDKCRMAVDFIPASFKNDDLELVKEWINSEEQDFDESKLAKQKTANPFAIIIVTLLLSYGVFFLGMDLNYLSCGRYFQRFLTGLSLLDSILSVSLIYAFGFSLLVAIIKKGKQSKKVFTILFLIFFLLGCFIFKSDLVCCFERYDSRWSDSDEELIDSYDYDDYSSDDYDYSSDDSYSIDASSEPYDDIDIMNLMIILEGYLKNNGIIEDYYTNLLISYTAKGNVRGTVYRDEDYEYNLYDNGLKKDENGNNCLEIVLEAEPLDENGYSLGQAEASLKGFYLVNIETYEIIDEHKTHW
ncbi:hypothetical protein SAMN05421493_101629 [Pseudobutyrivibrio sp. 49]|uniref:hypothetical protein n=1 Tax=Pseudobutyrivibrio sp. 49 TaxID=1855344 RepID=UPI00088DB994|nr:hypothetical protein [Pseudobutyrivibrio sp. 49]SDH47211.1 hypothetical protein SAMN05421493_101629 [Pseudobutyrivibrio sp. 49]